MTVENLASVFAPNILRQADYDPDVEMSVTPVITLTVAGFIRRHMDLFRYELTHFEQLCSNAQASNINPTSVSASTAPPIRQSSQVRQNFSEPPPEIATALIPAPTHFIRNKSGKCKFEIPSQMGGGLII